MATIQGTELLIEATVAKLRNGLEARVAAINAQKGLSVDQDDITIVAARPEDVLPFGGDTIHRWPTIVVTQGREGIDQFTIEGPHSLGIRDQILIGIMETDANRQRLGYKLLRQARAVAEVLWDDEPKERLLNPHDGTEAAFAIQFETFRPGPAFGHDDERSLWKDTYEIILRASRVEEGF